MRGNGIVSRNDDKQKASPAPKMLGVVVMGPRVRSSSEGGLQCSLPRRAMSKALEGEASPECRRGNPRAGAQGQGQERPGDRSPGPLTGMEPWDGTPPAQGERSLGSGQRMTSTLALGRQAARASAPTSSCPQTPRSSRSPRLRGPGRKENRKDSEQELSRSFPRTRFCAGTGDKAAEVT